MRIISGRLGGRTFDAPRTNRTHPMSERMRGALFNTLGDIDGLSVLDAFGGSGALSFESISRGATGSVVTEVNNIAYRTIIENVKKLGLEAQIKAVRANVTGWSDKNPGELFDLVLCNPPFDGLEPEIINRLTKHLKNGGLLVLSWPSKKLAPPLEGLDMVNIKEKEYGDAQLVFYRKVS